MDKALSDISAIQNTQQAKLKELTAAVERSSLEAKKSNTELLTAVATQRAANNPEPNQEVNITWWGFIFLKLFGGWKRIIITLSITVITFLIFKVFEKNILIFLYEVISERLKLILPPLN